MADDVNALIYTKQGGRDRVYESGASLEMKEGSSFIPPVVAASTPGSALVIPVAIADSAGDTDITMARKVRVIDVVAVKTANNGGSGDTLTVKNGSNAITGALDLNVSDAVVVRAGSIDDATHEISAGGTLRLTAAKNTNCACIAYVHVILVA